MATSVTRGQKMTVSSGLKSNRVEVLPGGTQLVYGGTANNTCVSGGVVTISAGGSGSFTLLFNSGAESILSGGVEISGFVFSGGTETVSAGGVASTTKVSSGGTEIVSSGGVASDTTVSSGGVLEL